MIKSLWQRVAPAWLWLCAAVLLGCTTSQLVKFLKLEPEALQQLNRERLAHGQKPLK